VMLLSARDLARLGLLYLNDTIWAAKQVVPSWWVKESTKRWSDACFGLGYGYMWWDLPSSLGLGGSGFAALGHGGQAVAVIPDRSRVAAPSSRETIEDAGGGGIEISENIRLDAMGKETQEQVPRQMSGRLPAEARSPAGAQARKVKIAQRRDLGLYLGGATHHAAPRDRDARTVPAMRYTVRPASSWLLRMV
jgi:hypothetical protein